MSDDNSSDSVGPPSSERTTFTCPPRFSLSNRSSTCTSIVRSPPPPPSISCCGRLSSSPTQTTSCTAEAAAAPAPSSSSSSHSRRSRLNPLSGYSGCGLYFFHFAAFSSSYSFSTLETQEEGGNEKEGEKGGSQRNTVVPTAVEDGENELLTTELRTK